MRRRSLLLGGMAGAVGLGALFRPRDAGQWARGEQRIVALQGRIRADRKNKRRLSQIIRRQKITIAKRNEVIKKLKLKLLEQQFKKGAKKRYFSDSGGLTLAVRWSIGKVGSHAIGMVMGFDVHGSTVRRWEIKARAAQLVSFRKWQAHWYRLAKENPRYTGGLRIATHRVRSDASNFNIWKEKKVIFHPVCL